MVSPLSGAEFAELKKLSTCAIADAIETFAVRLRNEGFVNGSIQCLIPRPEPMVGYAVTARILSSDPPRDGHAYVDRTDWWNAVKSVPSPRIVVIQDVDKKPGFGSLIGEVHASILMALDCVGVVTNGAVRDVPALEKMNLHAFTGGVALSHAYSHIVDFGQPVEVGSLVINTGDLLHGDRHGVISVPHEIAGRIPAAAAAILESERRVIALCRAGNLSLDELRAAVKDVNH